MALQGVNEFLIDLKFNNNRPWLQENNDRYQEARKDFNAFIDELIPELKKIDKDLDVESSKECVFRIFRDVRFSNNKEPYKTNFGAYIARGGRKSPYAGYYVHCEPDQSFLGGGVYMPESSVLLSVRNTIHNDAGALKRIIDDKKFKAVFPSLYGDSLKSAPRGFPKDFPELDLLKYKNYVVSHALDNETWEKDSLLEDVLKVFSIQLPFNQYLNRIIGTNQ